MVVRVGMRFTIKGVTVEIVETALWELPTGSHAILVGYVIHDGDYHSQVAHVWFRPEEQTTEKVREKFEAIVDFYKKMKVRGVIR